MHHLIPKTDNYLLQTSPESPVQLEAAPLGDNRFRSLLTPDEWSTLPQAVRNRFSKTLTNGRTVVYTGIVTVCRISRAGWCLANLLRCIGAPLPVSTDTQIPATVVITEDTKADGQFWTRIYSRKKRFPVIIQSSKRFCGVTGLEEYIGYGVGIALRLSSNSKGLDFFSDHYFLEAKQHRVRIPAWLTPGELVVSHIDRGNNGFEFVLRLTHSLLGELVYQKIRFKNR
ncbi:MAG: DUF4166 domain-containing protein [Granulosicoccus sp.]